MYDKTDEWKVVKLEICLKWLSCKALKFVWARSDGPYEQESGLGSWCKSQCKSWRDCSHIFTDPSTSSAIGEYFQLWGRDNWLFEKFEDVKMHDKYTCFLSRNEKFKFHPEEHKKKSFMWNSRKCDILDCNIATKREQKQLLPLVESGSAHDCFENSSDEPVIASKGLERSKNSIWYVWCYARHHGLTLVLSQTFCKPHFTVWGSALTTSCNVCIFEICVGLAAVLG